MRRRAAEPGRDAPTQLVQELITDRRRLGEGQQALVLAAAAAAAAAARVGLRLGGEKGGVGWGRAELGPHAVARLEDVGVACEHRCGDGGDRRRLEARAAHQLAHALDRLDVDASVERRGQLGEPRAEPLDPAQPRRAELDPPAVARGGELETVRGDEVVRGGDILGTRHVGEVGGEREAQLQRGEQRLVEAGRCRGVGELSGRHLGHAARTQPIA